MTSNRSSSKTAVTQPNGPASRFPMASVTCRRSPVRPALPPGQVAHTLPGALSHARSGAESTITSLQTLSDSRLRLLAAVSLGFGAGLQLAGKRRRAALVGLAAASLFVFAILSRPQSANREPKPTQL